jgi:hypothetical protein
LESIVNIFHKSPGDKARHFGIRYRRQNRPVLRLNLSSCRVERTGLHQPEKLVPRALRKLAIARGFMVYEGLR